MCQSSAATFPVLGEPLSKALWTCLQNKSFSEMGEPRPAEKRRELRGRSRPEGRLWGDDLVLKFGFGRKEYVLLP